MSGTRFGARTQARGQALQLLFQAEATGRLVADVLAGDYVIDDMSSNEEGFSLSRDLDTYGSELALGADGMLHELDRAIDAAATNWSVGRMPSVDRNLLRLAIYEMACVDTVDVAISINEFVELAKAYGTDESSRFINGILGRVATRLAAGEDVLAAAEDDRAADETAEATVAAAEESPSQPVAEAQAPEAETAVPKQPDDAVVAATLASDATSAATPTADAAVDSDAKETVSVAPADEDDLPEWARG